MKKRAFLISGLVMTATALFLKTVDISYTVYISNKIGAEGMGLYQLIVSVYCLFITVSTSGISLAVTRLTTEESAKGNENTARYAMRKCVALSMLLSVTAGSVLFVRRGSSEISGLPIRAPSFPCGCWPSPCPSWRCPPALTATF